MTFPNTSISAPNKLLWASFSKNAENAITNHFDDDELEYVVCVRRKVKPTYKVRCIKGNADFTSGSIYTVTRDPEDEIYDTIVSRDKSQWWITRGTLKVDLDTFADSAHFEPVNEPSTLVDPI